MILASGYELVNAQPAQDLFFEDFENGPAQWSIPGTMQITNTSAFAGSYSQTFKAVAQAGDALTKLIPVTPGQTYYLHLAYMTLGGGGYIGIDLFNASQGYINEQWIFGDGGWAFTLASFDYNVNNMDSSLLGKWKVYSQAYTIPVDTNFIRIKTEDWYQGLPIGLPNGPAVYFDNIEWSTSQIPAPLVKKVTIDIKPGSYPNTINLGSSGVIPVVILSSIDFDAIAEVNPDSLLFEGAKVRVAGKSDKTLCHAKDINADNLLDLYCQFENQLQSQEGDSSAILQGNTYSGLPISGEDTIRIVP